MLADGAGGDAGAASVPVSVSVVIPNYNRAESVVAAVRSALDQDVEDIEVIVVDDGSKDDSVGRLRAIGDPRLIVVEQANAGASAARNTGIDHARGTYVAFLDSDDRFLPQHLSGLLALLAVERNLAVYSQVIADRGNGRRLLKPNRGIRPGEDMATYLMCDRGFVQTSSLALSRSVAKAVRYREDVGFGDDTDFAVRLQQAGCRFVMAPVPSVIWIDDPREDRLSNTKRPIGDLTWLADLRRRIPRRAYLGYLGWHVAKSEWPRARLHALRLYFTALLAGSYRPRLAAIVLMQICVPSSVYRGMADQWIAFQASVRRMFGGAAAERIVQATAVDPTAG